MHTIRTTLTAAFFSVLLAMLLGACAQAAHADETAQHDNQLWLMSGMWSWHDQESKYHYNQTNYGIGLEYKTPGDMEFVAGYYQNSLNYNSKYFGVIHDPYRVGQVHLGYVAMFVSGYTRNAHFMPAIAPVASYEYHGVGVNLIWVPTVVVAVQAKLLVW